jgi:CDP-diacylglycerol---glycerol-3-phosphate 3-phosphatidyltransferase
LVPTSLQSQRMVHMAVDETAIVTWANMVTVTRVLASPFLFLMIPDERVGSWAALAVWILLCSSDGFDGYLARRHGITRSGAFLDPLADKILVLGAMFTLVSRDVFWVLPVVIIAAREIAVSLYRVFAGSKGVSMPASKLAKVKTVMQQCAVGFALLPVTINDATWTYIVCLWVAVALTLVSAAQYAQRALVSTR